MRKYSKELVEEVSKHIQSGLTAQEAALVSDIGESTFYLWQQEKKANGKPNPYFHLEFLEAIKKAMILRKQFLLLSIKQDRSWQSKAWLAERLYPELQQLNYTNQRLDEIETKLNKLEEQKPVGETVPEIPTSQSIGYENKYD